MSPQAPELGIRLYHLTQSSDWKDLISIKDEILNEVKNDCFDPNKSEAERSAVMAKVTHFNEIWNKIETYILNTKITPTKE